MTLYSEPPELWPWSKQKPTLLVCWWMTMFCTIIILLRVSGRYIRTERLFMEDKFAALAVIPLFLRMACVHAIIVLGTNNAQLAGTDLSDHDLWRRSVGSGLVLASRIFYAATLWILKTTILEFFKRLTGGSWERSSHITLQVIRGTLVVTFVAIVISTFAECRPFHHYWQVLPDPGGQCRQGYAQLITMAACNILTDLLLVLFPVPIIVGSHMRTRRKVQLVLLFSLSLAVVAVTLYRVPMIINYHGRQQLRSLLASVELLFATTAANALVLGSFVRDRGVKKRKYKMGSMADSIDRSSGSRSRRPTMNRHWGSDEDLVRDLGLGVHPELRERPEMPESPGHDTTYHPAPLAHLPGDMNHWQFGKRRKSGAEKSDSSTSNPDLMMTSSLASPRKVSFFDVGGLLADDSDDGLRRASHMSTVDPIAPPSIPASAEPAVPAGTSGVRRGSTALLQDLGGFLTAIPRSKPVVSKPPHANGTELKPVPAEATPEPPPRSRPNSTAADMVFLDPGGLLGPEKQSPS